MLAKPHKDVLHEQPKRPVDKEYKAPAGLSTRQEKVVAECRPFLSPEKVAILTANLLRGVRGLPGFTPQEEQKARKAAAKQGQTIIY